MILNFKTLSGKTYCEQAEYKKSLGNIIGMKGNVQFNESCLIPWNNYDDGKCAQKIIGWCIGTNWFGVPDPHNNSIRIAFSEANILNKKVYARLYYYNGGKNTNMRFERWNIADPLPYIVQLDKLNNKIQYQIGNMSGENTFNCKGLSIKNYMEFLYIEGTRGRPSPADVWLTVNNHEWIYG